MKKFALQYFQGMRVHTRFAWQHFFHGHRLIHPKRIYGACSTIARAAVAREHRIGTLILCHISCAYEAERNE